jgi:hypothetical protein
MYLITITLFLIAVVFYLSLENINLINIKPKENNIDPHRKNNHSVIEFLTQHTQRVEKDYTIPPKSLSSSCYNVTGSIIDGSHAAMCYQFPLVNGKVSNLKIDLKPHNVSALVDQFGLNSPYVSRIEDGIRYVIPQSDTNEFNRFQTELSAGSWHIDEDGKLSVDYKKVVQNNQVFCTEISQHILKELQSHQSDTYFNRVQAVLNFVQHIPYGQPTFDKNNFNYLGLALPPESFVLNYSDCDSKSIFFASILSNLIQADNIVLVRCVTSEPHMMVAVKGLNINTGQHVECDGDNFLLLETTTPCVIGQNHWDYFELKKIVKLA